MSSKRMRWYTTDDTPRWSARATRFLIVASVVVVVLVLLVIGLFHS